MPLIFLKLPDSTTVLAGHATLPYSSTNPDEIVISDQDWADLTPEQQENPERLMLADAGRRVSELTAVRQGAPRSLQVSSADVAVALRPAGPGVKGVDR